MELHHKLDSCICHDKFGLSLYHKILRKFFRESIGRWLHTYMENFFSDRGGEAGLLLSMCEHEVFHGTKYLPHICITVVSSKSIARAYLPLVNILICPSIETFVFLMTPWRSIADPELMVHLGIRFWSWSS